MSKAFFFSYIRIRINLRVIENKLLYSYYSWKLHWKFLSLISFFVERRAIFCFVGFAFSYGPIKVFFGFIIKATINTWKYHSFYSLYATQICLKRREPLRVNSTSTEIINDQYCKFALWLFCPLDYLNLFIQGYSWLNLYFCIIIIVTKIWLTK